MWPRLPIRLPEDRMYLVYHGKMQVHEFWHAMPHRIDYETRFKIMPTAETKLGEYFPQHDLTLQYAKEGDEWTIL